MQQILTWLIVSVAAFLVLRHVWAEVRGLFDPDNKGCVGCNACENPAEEPAFSGRPAPQIKMTPIVPLQTELPPHLRHLRKSQPERHACCEQGQDNSPAKPAA